MPTPLAGWVRVAVVAIAYIVAGKLALLMAIPPGYATALWPSAGIALIAVWRWGWLASVGVFLGSFAVNFNPSLPAPLAQILLVPALIACGSSLQALAGSWLIRRFVAADSRLDRHPDVIRFFMLGGPVACLIAATIGTATLTATGAVPASEVMFGWFTWWIGDTVGVSLASPVILAAFGSPRSTWRPRLLTVAAPLVAGCIAVIVAFLAASRWERERLDTELRVQTSVIAHALEQRLTRDADAVRSTASFIEANPEVTPARFKTFATGVLGRDRDISGIAWAPRTVIDGKEQFVAKLVAPEFDLPVPTINLTNEPLRAAAIARAIATRQAAASLPLQLLRGGRGFVIAVPVVVDGSLAGVAVGGFSTQALIKHSLEGLDATSVRIQIYDITGSPLEVYGERLVPTIRRELLVAGRRWELGAAPAAGRPRSWQAWFVLAAGLVFVSALGHVLLVITGKTAKVADAEARYRDLYENAPDMYLTVEVATGLILDCNATTAATFGREKSQLIGRNIDELQATSSSSIAAKLPIGLREQGTVLFPHLVVRRANGTTFHVSMSASSIRDETGAIVAARALWRDVSASIEAAQDYRLQVEVGELLEATDSERAVLASAAARISEHLSLDICHFTEIDDAHQQVVVHQYYPPPPEGSAETVPISVMQAAGLGDLIEGRKIVIDDVSLDPRTQPSYEAGYAPRRFRAVVAIPLMRGGLCVAYFGAVCHEARSWTPREIALLQAIAERTWLWREHQRMVQSLRVSEREQRELSQDLDLRVTHRTAQLRSALTEKEALLKEIHHRVKNNLQVISSLLRLQAHSLADPTLRSAFDESQQRIQTIALVHEKLYQAKDLTRIGIDSYLRSLVDDLMSSQNASARGVSATTDVEGVELPIERAIPCGLIVNELVTNALKHGFPGGRTGAIKVTLVRRDDQVELSVSDDGVGLPRELDPYRARTLGLDLVHTFAVQLDATVDIRGGGGTAFTLRFAAGD